MIERQKRGRGILKGKRGQSMEEGYDKAGGVLHS